MTSYGSSSKSLDKNGVGESSGSTFHTVQSDNGLIDHSGEVSVAHAVERQRSPRCGWFCWRPDFLQIGYRWPLGLVLMCWFSFLQGFITHGITPVNSGHLQRRFQLSGTEIGWFNSVLELSAASSTILFSYLADRFHKPRWLVFSAFLFAVGCFILSLPHYIAEPYNGNGLDRPATCTAGIQNTSLLHNNTRYVDDRCSPQLIKTSSWLNVLIAGNVIVGVGAGIIFTVGVAFIDDFSDSASSSLRVAVMYAFVAVGSAVGFSGGAGMLQLDVNFNRPDWPAFNGNKDFNPKFVGAWWLGYAIGAAGFGTVAFGFSCLDYELPETASIRLTKRTETHKVAITIGDEETSTRPKIVTAFLKFIGSLTRLLANPVLVCITIASIAHGLMSDGVQPFFTEILRCMFVINQTKAGLSLAVIIVIAIGAGNVFSGILLRRYDFSLRAMLITVLVCITTGTILGFGFFIHCPQEKISGISTDYSFNYLDPIPPYDPKSLPATCNARCGCSAEMYQPVCYPKMAAQFYSPCHGGCRVQRSVMFSGRNITIYAGCDCLAPLFFRDANMTAIQQTLFMMALASMSGADGNTNCSINRQALGPLLGRAASLNLTIPQIMSMAGSFAYQCEAYKNFSAANFVVSGSCDASCGGFYGAMVILFFILFVGFFTLVPLAEIVMRCVPAGDRTFALAFYQSMGRFLGSIPGPIMVGAIIDRACILRDPNRCEGDEGACVSYNVPLFVRWLVGIFVGLHGFAIFFYVLAFILYKPPNGQTLKDFFLHSKPTRHLKQPTADKSEPGHDEPPRVASEEDLDVVHRRGNKSENASSPSYNAL